MVKKSARASATQSQATAAKAAATPQGAIHLASKIQLWPIERLKPYERNARVHSTEQIELIKGSILRFGFNVPILVDARDGIVAGHGRLEAARGLGMPEVPVVVLDHLSEHQRRAFLIADNRLTEIGGWDNATLMGELAALESEGMPADVLGFDESSLDEIRAELEQTIAAANGPSTEVAPEAPDTATSERGDVWVLGRHRLMCGDSSSPSDLDKLLDGDRVHLVNMDPPYNVKVEPRSNNAIAAGLSSFKATHHQSLDLARHPEKSSPTTKKLRAKDRPLENDFVTEDEFDRMLRAWFGNAARVLDDGRGFYIWGGYANCANYPPALKASGLYFSQAIIWVKEHPVLTRKDFMGNHEWCFYGWKEGGPHLFLGPANVSDTWSVKKVNPQSMVHLTEKPSELAARAMMYSSRAGEVVLDLFGGSGSTLIAAENLDRRARLMEIDTLYADVIVRRWQQYTGGKATLAGTDKTYEQVTRERGR